MPDEMDDLELASKLLKDARSRLPYYDTGYMAGHAHAASEGLSNLKYQIDQFLKRHPPE